jgi:hypothetical protein
MPDRVPIEVAKVIADSLPPGFMRKGRLWFRVADGLRQEVRVLRDRNTMDGSGSARIWVDVDYGLDGSEPTGAVKTRDASGDVMAWWLYANPPETRIDEVSDEIRQSLARIHEDLERLFTQDGYLLTLAQRPLSRLLAFSAFGRRDDAIELLDSDELRPHMNSRELDLEFADGAFGAFDRFSEEPSEFWVGFARNAVRAFGGRPPKDCRDAYERVSQQLDRLRRE